MVMVMVMVMVVMVSSVTNLNLVARIRAAPRARGAAAPRARGSWRLPPCGRLEAPNEHPPPVAEGSRLEEGRPESPPAWSL